MIEIVAHWLQTIPTDTALWCVVLVFIALDVIVGTVKAWLTGTISSEKARKGVMHKTGFIVVMTLCTLIDIAQNVADIGFSVPVLGACSVMIICCEIFSLCEHIQQLNPDIDLKFLHSNHNETTK